MSGTHPSAKAVATAAVGCSFPSRMETAEVPPHGSEVSLYGAEVPLHGSDALRPGARVPLHDSKVPLQGSAVWRPGAAVPPSPRSTAPRLGRFGVLRLQRSRLLVPFAFLLAVVGCGGGDGGGATEEAEGEAAARTDQVLRFSAIPDHNTTELRAKYDPVAVHLSAELGFPVEYVPSADYGASVEMFKNGDILLAWFGGLTGVQARQAVSGARAIVQGLEDPDYYSYFIAHASTGLERSDDFPAAIAGHKFTFGSQSSTSGRLMPEYFIRQATGKSPSEFFTQEFGFSGSHDTTIEQVANGTYEVGVCNYGTYDKMVASGKIDPKVCRVIWRTPSYADYNFTAHPDIDTIFGAGTIDRIQQISIAITDPGLLGAFQRSALIPATNSDFDNILAVARDLGMAR